ncbi:MAG: tetratricopeptide repeat protein [Chloroflexi bacterium]|nr:tetratricopeptide repeat protein [Chloroflexota bacterium]
MSKHRKPQLPKMPSLQPTTERNEPPVAERVQALLAGGTRLLAAKRPGEALPLLTEAWELAPDNAAAAINLGGAYILQGKHAQAVPVLEAAVRLEPDNPMVWINLAAAYLGKLPFATAERQERSIQAFERALALDPVAPNVHYNLGLIYLERSVGDRLDQDAERAAAHFTAALETNPNDRDAQHYLDNIRKRGE